MTVGEIYWRRRLTEQEVAGSGGLSSLNGIVCQQAGCGVVCRGPENGGTCKFCLCWFCDRHYFLHGCSQMPRGMITLVL